MILGRPGRPVRGPAALHRRAPVGLEHRRRGHRQRARPASGWTPTAPGRERVTVTLTAACDTSGAQQIPSDQPGTRRFERPLSLVPQFSGLRFYTFPGGCVTYRFSFAPGASPVLAVAADSALSFLPRSTLVDYVRRTEGLALCGRGAACPG